MNAQILIVDDDTLVLESLQPILEAEGHSVTASNGGQDGIDAFKLGCELFQRIGADLGHELDPVFGAQEFADLGIEHLPRELRRLLQHRAAVFRVSERMKIGAFVDEALAVGVDQQAENIAVFLELIADSLTRFRTRTRVLATDAWARRKFRIYWTFAGLFIIFIRKLINRAIRREAEREASGKHRAFHGVPKGGYVS